MVSAFSSDTQVPINRPSGNESLLQEMKTCKNRKTQRIVDRIFIYIRQISFTKMQKSLKRLRLNPVVANLKFRGITGKILKIVGE